MIIYSSGLEPRLVDAYDITFNNGLFRSIIVDKDSGDSIDYSHMPLATIFRLAARTLEPASMPEEITVYMNHVIMIDHSIIEQLPVSPDQRDEFQQTLHKMATSIN